MMRALPQWALSQTLMHHDKLYPTLAEAFTDNRSPQSSRGRNVAATNQTSCSWTDVQVVRIWLLKSQTDWPIFCRNSGKSPLFFSCSPDSVKENVKHKWFDSYLQKISAGYQSLINFAGWQSLKNPQDGCAGWFVIACGAFKPEESEVTLPESWISPCLLAKTYTKRSEVNQSACALRSW